MKSTLRSVCIYWHHQIISTMQLNRNRLLTLAAFTISNPQHIVTIITVKANVMNLDNDWFNFKPYISIMQCGTLCSYMTQKKCLIWKILLLEKNANKLVWQFVGNLVYLCLHPDHFYSVFWTQICVQFNNQSIVGCVWMRILICRSRQRCAYIPCISAC